MLRLVHLYRRFFDRYEAYCVACRAHRRVTKVRYVKQNHSKRLEGVCQTCSARTSSYVATV